ncbi:MAG: L-lactate dehydrogenase [Clostridia bacterium]|nr:L-lactate dehydrogenase [Clostridia bacterium]
MSNTKGSKICVIGAGAVGATCTYALTFQQLASEIVLIDVNKEKAQGEVLDISHGLPFLGQMDIHAGDYDEIAGADVIIITAGIPRKPGETRMDLAKKNVNLAKIITDSIMKYYTGGVILVVSNPCDVVTYKIAQWSGLPATKVVGSGTNLDSARLRYLLAQHLGGIDIRNVHGYMLGEHGETQFPAWSLTHIAGVQVDKYAQITGKSLTEEEKADIAQRTKAAGSEIIKLKGATYNGIAVSAMTLVRSILTDEHTIRTCGAMLNGEYGMKDIVLNVPVSLGKDGIERIIEAPLTDLEMEYLRKSEENVRAVLDSVKDM